MTITGHREEVGRFHRLGRSRRSDVAISGREKAGVETGRE
jgi:hypothetical protein